MLFDLKTPEHFFYKKIQQAKENKTIFLPENVEFYLLQLLCNKIQTFDFSKEDRCLAILLQKAIEAPFEEKIILLKKMGDNSLYLAGFFPDHFKGKPFNLDYYVCMGETAYKNLAGMLNRKKSSERAMSKIYQDMSQHFTTSISLLTSISKLAQEQDKEEENMGSFKSIENFEESPVIKENNRISARLKAHSEVN